MKKRENARLNYIVFALVIAVAILTVVRIFTNTTVNLSYGVASEADHMKVVDGDVLRLEGDAPLAELTGFSFRFEGNRDNFENAGFQVIATVQKDSSDSKILYENELPLMEQAYDYQNESYIVIIPFDGDIQQGDHLCITVLGVDISKEAGVVIKNSSQSNIAGTFYYQTRKLDAFPILIQGIVFILLILLVGELLKKTKVNGKSKKYSLKDHQIFTKKNIIKFLPVAVFLVAALDYTCYAGVKMQMQESNLSFKMTLLFLMFSCLVIGLTLVVFLSSQNKMKLEMLLFLTIVCLGLLFEIVITPFAVPDEASHIDTAYRISNQMLGIEDTGIKDAIYKRECDINTDSGVKRTISWETYKWLYNDWFNTEGNRSEKLIFAADVRKNANTLFFLPAAVSMTIGRILGIGFLPIIYLARTVNLLLAAWMIYLAVKKLPFGKSILCIIALFPITLQEIASCSYDALIIPISMLYVSYCVFAIYNKEKLERADILVIIITGIMLAICKGAVYTPLYLLVVWILIKRGYFRLPQKKGTRIAGMIAVSCVVLAAIIGIVHIYRQFIFPLSFGDHYSLGYLIRYPWVTLRIIENSLYKDTYYYVEQLFGKALGSFQISVKFLVPIGYMILLGRAVICSEKYPYIPKAIDKCVFMTTALLCFATVQLAFLLTSTPFGGNTIGGVQGRYFLPIVWLFLICFRRGNIVDKNKKYAEFVLAGYILGVCTALQVVIEAFGVN